MTGDARHCGTRAQGADDADNLRVGNDGFSRRASTLARAHLVEGFDGDPAPVYGTEVLDRYLDGGLNERGHGRHDRIGKDHADFDRLTAFDLNRTEWPRFETTAESGSREHHESEYQALSDEKRPAHFLLLGRD